MAKGNVLVRLKRDWFSPDGSLYQVKDNPHSFPAEWADKPGELTDEQKADGKVRSPKQKYAVLPSTAEVVEAGKTVAVKVDTANGTQLTRAEAVEGDVKSVGGALNDKGLEEPSQTLAKAESAAEDLNVDAGGNPQQSGPLPAGAKKLK
jgi:hypothetical protein